MTDRARELERLRYIAESIARIREYTVGGRASFLGEPIVQDAVLRRLETLADAADKLSDELKARHPAILWRAIRGFRNVAAHAYEDVELAEVWQIVVDHLPPLSAVIDVELLK